MNKTQKNMLYKAVDALIKAKKEVDCAILDSLCSDESAIKRMSAEENAAKRLIEVCVEIHEDLMNKRKRPCTTNN
jgi:hypothetical protein